MKTAALIGIISSIILLLGALVAFFIDLADENMFITFFDLFCSFCFVLGYMAIFIFTLKFYKRLNHE